MTDSAILVEKLAAAWPPERWRDTTVLIAFSGGADSVALLHGLVQLKGGGEGRLIVAHYNHRLRGAESDADQTFVEQLARQRGLEAVVGQATEDLATNRAGEGLEGAARIARYEFLAAAASRCGARYVAMAHTADDQVETILHNILRGTGLAGLAGIPRTRRLTEATSLMRPLLGVTRCEVLEYLKALSQPFREDSTNELIEYTRNRIRRELLPLLERDFNPRAGEALLRLARIADEADEWLRQQAGDLLQTVGRFSASGLEIQVGQLRDAHPALVWQVLVLAWEQQGWPLQDMSLEKWEQLQALARQAGPPQTFPGGIRAEVHGGVLRLSRLTT